MPATAAFPDATPPSSLWVSLAQSAEEIRASQRLRHQVFAREMGARLHTTEPGVDQDAYDPFCDHLLVRESTTGELVASTRILSSDRLQDAGGYYSASEFELGALQRLHGRVMEVGRTCVRADYRTGSALHLLWMGLARYMMTHGFEYLMGCASIPYTPGDRATELLLDDLLHFHASPLALRAQPRRPLPRTTSGAWILQAAEPPSLLKAYLRFGAKICGEAYWDVDFGVADVLILVDVRQVPARYRNHFLREVPPALRSAPVSMSLPLLAETVHESPAFLPC